MQDDQPLPCNIEAERSLLGALMLNNDTYVRTSTIVGPEAFHEPIHAHIWKVAGQMIEAGTAATPITLKTYLGDMDLGEGMTPMKYLASLAAEVGATSNAVEYAKVIRDSFILRRIISIADSARNLARNFPADLKIPDAISDLERDLDALIPSSGGESSNFVAFGDIDTSYIHNAYRDGESNSGISTGFPRLDEAMGGLQETDLIVLAGRPAMGKAQPLDAAIKTVDGWTTMGEIRLGQAIASPDGRFSVVTGIFPQGVKPIFEVTFSDGRKTRACGEHLWRVRSRHWDAPRVLSTDDVRALLQRKRHQGRLSIDLVTGDFGRSGYLPLDPWLLGMILGNGRLSGSIKLTTSDEENLARAERFLPTGMCIARNENGTHSLRQRGNWRRPGQKGVSPNPIAAYLRAAGLSDEGCHAMFVPTSFMSACRADRMALLQGMMDSNGYVEKKGAVRFVTTSLQLAHDVESLVRSLGGLCRVVSKKTSYSHKGVRLEGRTAYICRIRHEDASVLFANSEKRQAATRGRNSSVRLTIASIEPAGSVEAQCISVSHPESLYITDDYIVTHNTSLAVGIGVHVARLERRLAKEEGRRPRPTGIFSLEMAGEQLKGRVLAEQSNVSAFRLRRGDVAPAQMEAFVNAERETRDLPFYIDESGELTIAQLRMKARRFVKKRGKPALLIVDYLQLLKGSQRKGENRTQEVTEITTGLKALAKELGCPVLALSQLSRKVEERDDKRPILADLRECVTGDTLLTDAATGRRVPIRDVRAGMKVLGLTPSMKVAVGPVADCWSTGVKPIFRVTTRTGRVIRATENHPFLTGRGWQPLKDLRTDDRLASPYRALAYGREMPERADLCRLLGYMAGNGSMQEHRTMGVIIPDNDAFADACAIIRANWPEVQIKVRANGYNDAWISRTFENGHGAPGGNPMREWLRGLGLIGSRDDTKSVPDFVFEAGEIGARNFLAGYLATDGCVTNTGDRWSIRFDTTSHDLAQGVAALLTRLGVAAVIGSPTMSGMATKPIYRTAVCQSPENMRRFAEVVQPIGACGKRLDGMLAGLTDRATRNSIFVLPSTIGRYASANYAFRDQDKALSRQKAQELLSQKHDEVLSAYCESDLIWDEIRSIESCGEEEVFDITIPGLNCFIANGIVVHNSGSIEQDADIVMFVYREEYYLKQREPREDGEKLEAWRRQMERWKGIAEIIVGKYRGGSTGSAELGFVPHLTQFLPEPEFRQVDPEESRKNAKRVVLSDHAKELKRIMYELAVQGGRRPTAEDMAQPKPPHAKATMIDREELRRHFYDHVVSDLEDRQRRGALQRAADQLRAAKLTATFKDAQGRLWSYLIDMIED